jgi:hypothetical protein
VLLSRTIQSAAKHSRGLSSREHGLCKAHPMKHLAQDCSIGANSKPGKVGVGVVSQSVELEYIERKGQEADTLPES